MLKSTSFRMDKGNNPTNFRILCAAARMLTKTGEVLKAQDIKSALDEWDIRPVEFAEALAGQSVPVEYRTFMGGNEAPTNCPDIFWAEIGTKALLFRDCKQYLRCALRSAATDGTLPEAYRVAVCHLVHGTITGIYGELVDAD